MLSSDFDIGVWDFLRISFFELQISVRGIGTFSHLPQKIAVLEEVTNLLNGHF
jgi:hypothetical protein